jgi:YMGG-like Gly-zipper
MVVVGDERVRLKGAVAARNKTTAVALCNWVRFGPNWRVFNMRMAFLSALALLAAAACTSTGNVERGALGGAVLGGVAGAVIGNNTGSGDAAQGAAIGAVIGAAGGAYAGCVRDGGCGAQGQTVNQREFYDQRSGRYYFRDARSGRYFYENGESYP